MQRTSSTFRTIAHRMEIIQLSGYLAEEKIEIARNHLLPRQIRRAGLKRDRLRIHKRLCAGSLTATRAKQASGN